MPSMIVRVAIGILSFFPLSLAFRAIPRGSVAKHVFSAAMGSLAVLVCTSAQHFAHMSVITLASYALVQLAPRRHAGWAVLLYAFAHVFVVHLARDGALPYLLDAELHAPLLGALNVRQFQVLVMGATLKAGGFALSWADGARPAGALSRLHASQRLGRMPSLLRYWGYMFFFPSVFGHPTFYSYAEYEHAAGDERPLCAAAVTPVPPLPPLDWRTIAQRLCEGLGFGAIHALAPRFTAECSAGVYAPLPCYCASVLSLSKFYAFWRVSDGPIVIAGLLPSAQLAGAEHFTRVRHTLLAPDFAFAVRMWNLPVARFLKVHVFARSPRALSASLTFAFSSLWHGVAPGYFLAASTALLFLSVTSALQPLGAVLAPPSTPALHAAWGAAGRALSHGAAAFLFLPMMTLTGAETLAMLRALKFAPYFVAGALLLGSALVPVPASGTAAKRHSRTKENGSSSVSSSSGGGDHSS